MLRLAQGLGDLNVGDVGTFLEENQLPQLSQARERGSKKALGRLFDVLHNHGLAAGAESVGTSHSTPSSTTNVAVNSNTSLLGPTHAPYVPCSITHRLAVRNQRMRMSRAGINFVYVRIIGEV